MTDPTPPTDPTQPNKSPKDRGEITGKRIAAWVIVGGVGIYLVIEGIIGIVSKG